MLVLLLTAFVSLVLVAFFLILFWRERTGDRSICSAERDALLPFHDAEDKSEGAAAEEKKLEV